MGNPTSFDYHRPTRETLAGVYVEATDQGCAARARGDAEMSPQQVGQARLSSDEVLKIARLDAERACRDLTPYRIAMALEADGWHVDYQLKDPCVNGGGSRYVIEPSTGAILAKRYEQ